MKFNQKLLTKSTVYLLIFILTNSLFAEVVSTINKSGEDYNTLTLWEDAVDGILTEIQTAELYAEQGALDDRVNISASTTDADKYMRITVPAADRHEGVWSDSKSRIVPTSDGDIITINDNFTRVTWLQLFPLSSAATSRGVFTFNPDSTISHCIIDGHGSSFSIGIQLINATDSLIYRNIIFDCDDAFEGGGRQAGGTGIKLYCNTIFRCNGTDSHGWRADGNTQAIDNAIFDCATDFTGTYAAGSGYNADSDGTSPGSNNQNNKDSADQFVSETDGSEDLHLKSGADCIDNGTDVGSPYDVDIDGVSVTGTWDIGADEFVSAPPPPSVGAVPMILMLD